MSASETSGRFSIDASAQIGEVGLFVADLKRSRDFYVNVLGFRVATESTTSVRLRAGTNVTASRTLLVLTERPGAEARPPRTQGLYHFAVLVPSRYDLACSLKRISETGTRLQGAADHLVSEALYLVDPDGNGIEIYRDRAETEWTWIHNEVKMDTLPLDFGNLLEELARDRKPWEGLPAGTRMGHIHLHVADLRSATRFYIDTLGFSTVAKLSGALFVSAGNYHHHIGLNTWAAGNVAPANAAGLDYFEIRLPTAVSLGTVTERLLVNGYRLDEDWDGVLAYDPFGNRVVLSSHR